MRYSDSPHLSITEYRRAELRRDLAEIRAARGLSDAPRKRPLHWVMALLRSWDRPG